MGKISAVLALGLWLAFVSANATSVELQAEIKRYDLGSRTLFLEDPTGSLTLPELLTPQFQDKWQQNQGNTINFAFSSSVYWLRVDLHATLTPAEPWLFEIAFPLQDFVDFYIVEDGNIEYEALTGDRRKFSTRPIAYRNFLFPVDIKQSEYKQVYIRLANTDGLHEPIPMILWDATEFTLTHGERSIGLGLYFGIMVVMALYNLFLYASVRDITYLYYVTYIVGFSFWLFSYYGFSFQYLWPKHPTLGNQSTIFLTCVWTIFMAQFVVSYLNANENLRWFARVMRIYIGCMIVTMLVSFSGNYSIGIFSVIGLGFPACIAGIVAGVVSWRSGYRPARFFLLAWSALLLSLIVFCLKIAGVLPPLWFIERSVQIGSALEVILLSLGLADRINVLKKEKFAAQSASIQSYESNLKLRNDFIASISHELRTPMNAIFGGVEIAQDTTRDQSDSIDIIKAGAHDMMSLVDDILIHTEIQSGQITVEKESAKVSHATSLLTKYYGRLCESRDIAFSVAVDDAIPEWIMTDRHKLTVILTKLLDNAVKFTERGAVDLSISRDDYTEGSYIVCSVSDTGAGIPQDKLTLIFDPFVQVEGGFTRRHGGMGIGLSICARLADALQGQLTVESTVGSGSCFTYRFPLEVGEPQIEEFTDTAASQDTSVLVVEDNVVNQKVIVKMLTKLGADPVLVANHGEEAVAMLATQTPALILMDLQMPVMDGFSCTEAIRQSQAAYANTPIVALTANVMDADRSRCEAIGMNDFLEKPVKLATLKACISHYVDL